jgi:hypothetical protein
MSGADGRGGALAQQQQVALQVALQASLGVGKSDGPLGGPQACLANRLEHARRGHGLREHGKAQCTRDFSREPAVEAAPRRPAPATLSWSLFSLKGKYGTGRAVDFAGFHRAVLAKLWQLEGWQRLARPTCISIDHWRHDEHAPAMSLWQSFSSGRNSSARGQPTR